MDLGRIEKGVSMIKMHSLYDIPKELIKILGFFFKKKKSSGEAIKKEMGLGMWFTRTLA